MQTRPPILPGSNVIRSNVLALPTDISTIAAFYLICALRYDSPSPSSAKPSDSTLPTGLTQPFHGVGVILGAMPGHTPANIQIERLRCDRNRFCERLLSLFGPPGLP